MSNTEQVKHRNQHVGTTFSVVERKVPCQYKFQVYVDFGSTDSGPWVRFGINDSELGIGFLPKQVSPELHVATV